MDGTHNKKRGRVKCKKCVEKSAGWKKTKRKAEEEMVGHSKGRHGEDQPDNNRRDRPYQMEAGLRRGQIPTWV